MAAVPNLTNLKDFNKSLSLYYLQDTVKGTYYPSITASTRFETQTGPQKEEFKSSLMISLESLIQASMKIAHSITAESSSVSESLLKFENEHLFEFVEMALKGIGKCPFPFNQVTLTAGNQTGLGYEIEVYVAKLSDDMKVAERYAIVAKAEIFHG